MEDARSKNRIYSYCIYGASIAVFLLSLLSYNIAAIIVVAILILFSVAYMNSGHLINSLLIKKMRIVEIGSGYKLAGNMQSIVRKVDGGYVGMSIAVLRPTNAIESGSVVFEDLLNKVKIPFEFCISLRKLDRRKILEGLETKRRMKELELSQAGSDYKNSNMLKRQIGALESEIGLVSHGNEPIEAVIKLRSVAQAETEGEASRMSLRQVEHVASMVASSFKLEYTIAEGEDLFDLF